MHVAVNTPAGPMEAVRSYPSISGGLPRGAGASAPALCVSRPARRSLKLQPTCSQSRYNDPLHRRLQRLCYLYRCFGCYRVKRTSSRVGLSPTEKHRLVTAHRSSPITEPSSLSGRRWRIGFPRRWPPSAAQTVRAVFPHTAFTKARASGMQSKVLIEQG
jgi:hypothetical protein